MTSFSSDFENPRPPVNLSVINDWEPRTGNLTRGGGSDLSFVILQKLDVMPDQLFANKVLANGLCQLTKKI